MDDLISRQAAIDKLETVGYDFSNSGLSEIELEEVCGAVGDVRQDMINMIKRLPSAQPERKTGRWINAYPDIESNPMFMYGICSECGFEQSISDKLNFCPNCGADMRGEEE